ncbi:hypothetical protein [Sphingomonas sp. NIBR02145]|uniref:hypothetical protein n=1 Tax=Sphingomonas sp. NIBR02145 TaxID=3014784 RepID=UPI0022B533A1|nr:hypothetical protein [Sphingomonas sp. NIBR02145]WHU02419.1 hypothetical protein O3305_19910 [Sphingomonas sp. NIBR02145]
MVSWAKFLSHGGLPAPGGDRSSHHGMLLIVPTTSLPRPPSPAIGRMESDTGDLEVSTGVTSAKRGVTSPGGPASPSMLHGQSGISVASIRRASAR